MISEPEDFQSGVRQRLRSVLADRIEYATNYGATHYRLAEWFTGRYGNKAFSGLAFWVRKLLKTEGRDRRPERQWSVLAQRLADRRYEAPGWVSALCQRVTTDYQRVFDSVKIRVEGH